MRISRLVPAAAVAAAVATLGATSAAADKPPQNDWAKFKVTVKGTQSSKYSAHWDAETQCDVSDYSTSGETVKFRSRKPVILTAFDAGTGAPLLVNNETGSRIPMKATIDRFHDSNITPPTSPDCEDNGGGVETGATPPDCGTKSAKWTFDIGYVDEKRDLLGFESTEGTDPFQNCSAGLDSFPNLIETDGRANVIGTELPPSELFDEKLGKLILIGKGRRTDAGMTYTALTDVRWEITLKRLKG